MMIPCRKKICQPSFLSFKCLWLECTRLLKEIRDLQLSPSHSFWLARWARPKLGRFLTNPANSTLSRVSARRARRTRGRSPASRDFLFHFASFVRRRRTFMQKSTAALASVVLDVVQHPATSITSFRPLPPSPLRAQPVRGSVCTQSSLAPISWAQPSRGTVGLSLGFGISATQSPTKAAPRPTQVEFRQSGRSASQRDVWPQLGFPVAAFPLLERDGRARHRLSVA